MEPLLDQIIWRIENIELPALHEQLAPLVSGEMHLGERRMPGGAWRDTTQQEIERLKGSIQENEKILAGFRAQKG